MQYRRGQSGDHLQLLTRSSYLLSTHVSTTEAKRKLQPYHLPSIRTTDPEYIWCGKGPSEPHGKGAGGGGSRGRFAQREYRGNS